MKHQLYINRDPLIDIYAPYNPIDPMTSSANQMLAYKRPVTTRNLGYYGGKTEYGDRIYLCRNCYTYVIMAPRYNPWDPRNDNTIFYGPQKYCVADKIRAA